MQVLPLDDADLLERAKPITPSGVKLDREKVTAREDAQVKEGRLRPPHTGRLARLERQCAAARRRQLRVSADDDEAVQGAC